ncbi:hypothetical protein PtA15_7A494 [Puccinia triticina]|uniref:Uncharacterized protein n=1 Tax=Puccinia triticina TaxID=208348 RepID=A0ABY7CSM5_9BASI|nr:uncharacterized protein PtA15_7A494 [Puccinia triticina]WAQ86765.1 hypothetical protein PtA15_7A494 [Puccinia triticina]WAR56633.1 hypothetical protein PtB15_7B483 [Puccinia triticina]
MAKFPKSLRDGNGKSEPGGGKSHSWLHRLSLTEIFQAAFIQFCNHNKAPPELTAESSAPPTKNRMRLPFN